MMHLKDVAQIGQESFQPGVSLSYTFSIKIEMGVYKLVKAGAEYIHQVLEITKLIRQKLKRDTLLQDKRLSSYKEICFYSEDFDTLRPGINKLMNVSSAERRTVAVKEYSSILSQLPIFQFNKSKYYLEQLLCVVFEKLDYIDKTNFDEFELIGFKYKDCEKGEYNESDLRRMLKENQVDSFALDALSGLRDEDVPCLKSNGDRFSLTDEWKKMYLERIDKMLEILSSWSFECDSRALRNLSARSSLSGRSSLKPFSVEKLERTLRKKVQPIKWLTHQEYRENIAKIKRKYDEESETYFSDYDAEVKYGLRDSEKQPRVCFRFETARFKF